MKASEIRQLTEEQARSHLETLRWPKGVECHFCAKSNITKTNGGRVGLYQCRDCRKQFTVTVGTIFEGSHIPLAKWVYAVHLVCASKKGISALQLSRMLGITYKCAWHMSHRIRNGMKPFFPNLKGRVEVDETYVGGKITDKQGKHGTGRGTTNKTALMVMVERDGAAVTSVLPSLKSDDLHSIIEKNVVPSATILTDELKGYNGIGASFKGGHHRVRHSARKWVRNGWIYTNTAESFFALFKRGIHGSFHHVSKKHLQRYGDEFSFRWTNRKVSDAEREGILLRSLAQTNRLRYRSLVDDQAQKVTT